MNFQFEKLNEEKPKYILFWEDGLNNYSYNEFNFSNCLGSLVAENQSAGSHAARNPFNRKKKVYSAKIFNLKENVDLKKCVKIN